MKFCEYMKTDWFQGLQREVDNSTKANIAKKMGICRAKLSQVMNGCGAYGQGTASTAHIEREYRRTFEQLTCPHTQAQVGIELCREYALSSAPTQNPIRMMQWQSCQQCPNKPKPITVVKTKAVTSKSKAVSAVSGIGNATSGQEASDEGWNCIGGLMDNPYPVEDTRHDYWIQGYQARREFDRKHYERWNAKDVQQAGIIDKVTLPLPEVGAPQVMEVI